MILYKEWTDGEGGYHMHYDKMPYKPDKPKEEEKPEFIKEEEFKV